MSLARLELLVRLEALSKRAPGPLGRAPTGLDQNAAVLVQQLDDRKRVRGRGQLPLPVERFVQLQSDDRFRRLVGGRGIRIGQARRRRRCYNRVTVLHVSGSRALLLLFLLLLSKVRSPSNPLFREFLTTSAESSVFSFFLDQFITRE